MSSARRTPTQKPVTLDMKVNVPPTVVDTGKDLWARVWDADCPFASLFLWISIIMGIYYLAVMPELSVRVEDKGKVEATRVSQSLRAWLFFTVLFCGLLGYKIIQQGCTKVGPAWSVLWFVAALILTGFVTRLVLASVQRVTLSQASDILRQMD